jgi:hypothetical protein
MFRGDRRREGEKGREENTSVLSAAILVWGRRGRRGRRERKWRGSIGQSSGVHRL